MPERRFTRPIQLAELTMATEHARRPLIVFIAGPYIERTSASERSGNSAAALLRISILEYIENNMRHNVVLGEHSGVLEVGHEQLRSQSSAAITELIMVRKTCDGVIIIPSSPGSFCEFGSWMLFDDIARKMLVLADAQFQNEPGYLTLGAYATAVHKGAQLRWVDYNRTDDILATVESFIHTLEDRVLVKGFLDD